ncbi:MAG: hypothetical protein U0X39_10290 [Bacteroidales bacterium]
MKKTVFILMAMFCLMAITNAQKVPIKFGDVDIEDLKMTTYPLDTTASAVILCDYGNFSSATLNFTRILRIKILKKDGVQWGNQVYPTNSKSMIKGITSNLENGKIVQDKLKPESIFSERVSESNYRMRAAMPNVKVGSVIDIQFTFRLIPQVWKFQETIPVKYSELVIEPSEYFRYKTNYFGYERLAVSTPSRWVAMNMPAFKAEPFINSSENYITKFEFDILDISVGSYIAVSTTWDVIFKNLMESTYFGRAIAGSAYLNDVAKSISSVAKSKNASVRMAVDEVKKMMKWDESESLESSTTQVSLAFKQKVGNSADVNLVLYQLLKKLDIIATPIAISTRDNGIISPLSPSSVKLNYVIVQAVTDSSTFLLDATEQYMPFNLLPFRCLNSKGRSIKETGSDWVDLGTSKTEKSQTMYELNLTGDLALEGKLSISSTDYAGFDKRMEYHGFNSEGEYVDDFISSKPGLEIEKARILNKDSIYKPFTEVYQVKLSDKVMEIGDDYYIQPLFYSQLTENPFKNDTRKYPVDFGYGRDENFIATIIIPDNYVVSAKPESVLLKLPNNGATYRYDVSVSENKLFVSSKLKITKTFYMPDEYSVLREFFNQIIKKQGEPVILKKK